MRKPPRERCTVRTVLKEIGRGDVKSTEELLTVALG